MTIQKMPEFSLIQSTFTTFQWYMPSEESAASAQFWHNQLPRVKVFPNTSREDSLIKAFARKTGGRVRFQAGAPISIEYGFMFANQEEAGKILATYDEEPHWSPVCA